MRTSVKRRLHTKQSIDISIRHPRFYAIYFI